MLEAFQEKPGLLYVVATFLPLASFAVILLAAMVRSMLRSQRDVGGLGQSLFELLGGDNPKWPAYVATAAIGLAFVCVLAGFIEFHPVNQEIHDTHEKIEEKKAKFRSLRAELKRKYVPDLGDHDEAEDYLPPEKEILAEFDKRAKAAKAEFAKDKDKLQAALKEIEKEIAPVKAKVALLTAITKAEEEFHALEKHEHHLEAQFSGHVTWLGLTTSKYPKDKERRSLGLRGDMGTPMPDPDHGTELRLGFKIDSLNALMFLMVTLIATLIHVFSIGYMSEELDKTVTDHHVHTAEGHLHRRGRFGRFFMFLSLFCFSMLNLILADNLFQIFLSWELVGICSYLLIGFYFERTSASNAANKAFITNRIGDAGFIIGMLILWTYVGTFNFEELFARLRAPDRDSHHAVMNDHAGQIVRGEPVPPKTPDEEKAYAAGNFKLTILKPGDPMTADTRAVLFPRRDSHFHADVFQKYQFVDGDPRPSRFGSMPYWLLVAAGLGIFLGCVGKSAQFPLQVWLPDAMEGPTPVSALIHAATMVAAGVYLVGRVFPLFTPEAQLVIAYTGAITLFVAATIALVQTDIKKVLAYSTVSQLGYMMLALGVGGWVAGQFHLITHAFFKALLFLCSGAVIYNCHHQQEMTKMGGLYPKMKITALTMLVGVLAIAGTPLFSGWYSKDALLAEALGFALTPGQGQHMLLFLLPLLTAGITTFYMFRMWFMTFTGKPRDAHVYEHAHEAPYVMTVPLMILAFFSFTVAWGWPIWDAEASALEHELHHAMPRAVTGEFGVNKHEMEQRHAHGLPMYPPGKPRNMEQRHTAQVNHHLAGNLALAIVILAFVFALLVYYYGVLDPAEAQEQFPGVHGFLWHKWYFDELYSAIIVRPALAVSGWFRAFDTYVIDGIVDGLGRRTIKLSWVSGQTDKGVVDGLVNLIARVGYAIGSWLRTFQTGYLRSYILFLVLAAVGIWLVLQSMAAGGP
jgi:NADH-quinone oxidoreductase subunit L